MILVKVMRKKLNRTALFLVEWIRNRTLRIRRFDRWDLGVLVLILVYGSVFSYFTVLKHDVFRTFGWDLGIFDQALSSTLQGKFLYYTNELYMIPSGCYFASHFSPILLVILPFYAIYPSSVNLLVIGSFALSFAAIPLYLAVRTALESKKIAFVCALLYLLYPAIQASNWFDFHTQQFLPLFVFSGFYFVQKKKWKFYLLSVLLALMIEEHVSFLVFLMSLYFLLTGSPRTIQKAFKDREFNQALISVAVMIVSIIWFLVAQYVKGTFLVNPQFLTRYKATSAFGTLGVETDPLLLPIYIVLNPQGAWSALMYDYPTKFFFMIILFAPLLFLPFKSKFCLIPVILLVPSLMSNYIAYYTIGAHYPLYLVPLIFMAFVFALKQFHASAHWPFLKTALLVSVLTIASTSPISPVSAPFGVSQKGLFWYPDINFLQTNHTESLHNLLQLIPPQASVLTQNHIFSHVSARPNAYVIPAIARFENDTQYFRELLDRSEYVLLDVDEWDAPTVAVYDEITNKSSYGIYALGFGCLLFKRNYEGEPFFKQYTENVIYSAYKDLTVSGYGKVIVDSTVQSGSVVFCPKGTNGVVSFGPYTFLLPGTYQVTFMVKAGEHGDGFVGTLDASSGFGQPILSKRDIYGFELRPNEWTNFTLSFSLTKIARGVEYRTFSGGSSDMFLDRVFLKRISPLARYDSGSKTLTPGSWYNEPGNALQTDTGNKTDDGFFVHYQNHTDDMFWFGPYWSLEEGNYSLTIFLKVTPSPMTPSQKVVALQVSADAGKKIIVRTDVYSSSFMNNSNSNWVRFSEHFEVQSPLKQVEFRGTEPSADYDVYLAYVLFERIS
jgi:uncharacterized membrane protein